MPHVVGLQGHTGRVGAGALQYLLKAHMADEIKLIIVHRPGSDVSMIPAGVEKRELDLANASEEEIKAAVSGLQVYTCVLVFLKHTHTVACLSGQLSAALCSVQPTGQQC
jgi:hypothetical protein